MKRPSSLILVFVLLCCGGCSTLRVSYDHVDWYLRFRINGYTSFTAQQKEEIHREVDAYMRWHRKNALPDYIALLKDAYGLIQRNENLRAEDITRLRGEYARVYKKTVEPAIRPTAHMLSTLDSGQIEELAKSYANKNRKQKDELLYGSEKKNLVMRAERNIDLVESLVGSLSNEQEEEIRAISMRMPFVAQSYIEVREANQAELLALLKSKAGEDKIGAFLSSWIVTPEANRTTQQQQAIHSYESAMDSMTAQIYNLLTDRQRAHLREKIAIYIGDLQYLTEEKVTAGTPLTSGCAAC